MSSPKTAPVVRYQSGDSVAIRTLADHPMAGRVGEILWGADDPEFWSNVRFGDDIFAVTLDRVRVPVLVYRSDLMPWAVDD